MHQDAHYYGVLAFARACGYKKEAAWSVAYASQFVDDAKINQLSIVGPTYGIDVDHTSPPSLLNMATCHSYTRIKTFNLGAMINNTCAFHFVPGCKGDGFEWKMVCRPFGGIIKNIEKDVQSSDDLIKLGVLLHAWADSFSHEGFSGLLSKVNDINSVTPGNRAYFSTDVILPRLVLWVRRNLIKERFDTLFDYMVPAYGHAQALHYPDEPYLAWSYGYDQRDVYYHQHGEKRVNNRERYRKAFESIRTILENFLAKNPKYKDLSSPHKVPFESLYSVLLKDGRPCSRIDNWKETIVRLKLLGAGDRKILHYDKGEQWFREAFANYEKDRFENRVVENVALKRGFADSHWYRYYGAVRWYKKRFHRYAHEQGLSFNHEPYL